MPLTHRNLTRTMKNIVNTYKLTPNDRSYLVMPLFHVHGLLAGFLAPLHSGGTVIVPPKFSATTFWPEFTKYKATWYTAGLSRSRFLANSQFPPSIKSSCITLPHCQSLISVSSEVVPLPSLNPHSMRSKRLSMLLSWKRMP